VSGNATRILNGSTLVREEATPALLTLPRRVFQLPLSDCPKNGVWRDRPAVNLDRMPIQDRIDLIDAAAVLVGDPAHDAVDDLVLVLWCMRLASGR
jgi:hypothetical protein